MLEELRKTVCDLHAELVRNALVTWTGGNIGGRDFESICVVIKPSAIRYSDLCPENMVVVDCEANLVEGDHNPSSDTQRLHERYVGVYGQLPTVR